MRQRASSPASENVSSPSKRPRLHEAAFHTGAKPNLGLPGQPVAVPNATSSHMLMAHGTAPQNMSQVQLQNLVGASQAGQAKSIQSYSHNLQQHHGSQMANKQLPNEGCPANQDPPDIVSQAPEISAYYNAPGSLDVPGRAGPSGPGASQQGGGNHALQDYQMQLMLLEQ